jgi:RND family efflux transporter MFP subunit
MKRFTLIRIILSLSVVILIILALNGGCSKEKDKSTTLEKKPIYVKVQEVKQGVLVKRLSYKGNVLPWKKANIGPDTSGRILKIYKKPGDKVKKGEQVAELDTTTLKLNLKQAEAAFEVAKAAYKDALLNYQRLKKLREKTAISQMQLEKAELALESADTRKKSAEAALNVVKHTLTNSDMRAPFDGVVTSKNMEEGDFINPMMGMGASVLTLMDLTKVKIAVDIPSEDIEKIQIGQDCKIKVNSLEDELFSGNVYSKNLAADPLSKTFKVEVVLENPGMKIKAGVFAEVKIEILRKENILLVPHSAVIDESYVILYNNGTAKKAKVKVGEKNEEKYEIVEGLSQNQQVVVTGNYDLKEGAKISLKGENK